MKIKQATVIRRLRSELDEAVSKHIELEQRLVEETRQAMKDAFQKRRLQMVKAMRMRALEMVSFFGLFANSRRRHEANLGVAKSWPTLRAEISVVSKSLLFDPVWYRQRYSEVDKLKLKPTHHYCLLGFRCGYSPGPEFSSSQYWRINPDVASLEINPLFHYEKYGRAEGRHIERASNGFLSQSKSSDLAVPSKSSETANKAVLDSKLAEALRLMKAREWSAAADLWEDIESTHRSEIREGVLENRSKCLRRLGKHADAFAVAERGIERFGETLALRNEWMSAAADTKKWLSILEAFPAHFERFYCPDQSVDISSATSALYKAIEHYGVPTEGEGKEATNSIEVISATCAEPGRSAVLGTIWNRAGEVEMARAHWDSYWEQSLENQKAEVPKVALIRPTESSIGKFDSLNRSEQITHIDPLPKVAIYTALFGEYDELRSPLSVSYAFDYICFSDIERSVPGWEVKQVSAQFDDPILNNRYYKLNPQIVLPEHKYSLYIDANMLVVGDLERLVVSWLLQSNYAAWEHPDCQDTLEEIDRVLVSRRSEPGPILDQLSYILKQGVGRHSGLVEANVIWRSHEDTDVVGLQQDWWNLVHRFGRRDQPLLGYLLSRSDLRPSVMPGIVGNSRRNDFLVKLPHKKTPLQIAGEAQLEKQFAPNVGVSGCLTASVRRPIVWIYRKAHAKVASTIMRGEQLSSAIKSRLHDHDVAYVNEDDIHELRDSLVILTKGFLKEISFEELSRFKEAGNIVLADYVDDPIDPRIMDLIDVYVASSIRQYLYVAENLKKPVHMITHHTDPRLENVSGPRDYCSIGYFGEMANARFRHELQGIVDFCQVSTKSAADANPVWINKLGNANVHYAIREDREIDGHKPFLKGFTAAACHSNILTRANEGDARFYLGTDYPYLSVDDTPEAVKAMIEYIEESFGSSEWAYALDVMASVRDRTSWKAIEKEVRSLVDMYS